jgi:uncharacterized membrane protein YoaK (UPF0700 family)
VGSRAPPPLLLLGLVEGRARLLLVLVLLLLVVVVVVVAAALAKRKQSRSYSHMTWTIQAWTISAACLHGTVLYYLKVRTD